MYFSLNKIFTSYIRFITVLKAKKKSKHLFWGVLTTLNKGLNLFIFILIILLVDDLSKSKWVTVNALNIVDQNLSSPPF